MPLEAHSPIPLCSMKACPRTTTLPELGRSIPLKQAAHQGPFSRIRRARDGDELPVGDAEVELRQNGCPVGFGQTADTQRGCRAPSRDAACLGDHWHSSVGIGQGDGRRGPERERFADTSRAIFEGVQRRRLSRLPASNPRVPPLGCSDRTGISPPTKPRPREIRGRGGVACARVLRTWRPRLREPAPCSTGR